MAIEKPPYGSPCNACGLCCAVSICPLGQIVFPRAAAPCPALEREPDGRMRCGLVASPGKYAPIRTSVHGVDAMSAAAADGVGVGLGCDARTEDERDAPRPPEFQRALEEFARNAATARKRVLRLWAAPR